MREYQLNRAPSTAPRYQIWEAQGKYLLLMRQIVNQVDKVPVHFSVLQCVQTTPTAMPITMNHQNAMRPMLRD